MYVLLWIDLPSCAATATHDKLLLLRMALLLAFLVAVGLIFALIVDAATVLGTVTTVRAIVAALG